MNITLWGFIYFDWGIFFSQYFLIGILNAIRRLKLRFRRPPFSFFNCLYSKSSHTLTCHPMLRNSTGHLTLQTNLSSFRYIYSYGHSHNSISLPLFFILFKCSYSHMYDATCILLYRHQFVRIQACLVVCLHLWFLSIPIHIYSHTTHEYS